METSTRSVYEESCAAIPITLIRTKARTIARSVLVTPHRTSILATQNVEIDCRRDQSDGAKHTIGKQMALGHGRRGKVTRLVEQQLESRGMPTHGHVLYKSPAIRKNLVQRAIQC